MNGVRIEQKEGLSHDKPKLVKAAVQPLFWTASHGGQVSKVQDMWRSGSFPDSETREVFKNASWKEIGCT